ncbi:MAG TPA: hypothetical protein P5132_03735 [Bacteroidales bacterium]|nr:hypothetical protein [Bacteroidales bacterium]
MENLRTIELSPSEAFERMQSIREKVHLDYATHEDIEELYELEYIFQDSFSEFQSEFWI